MDPTPGVGMVHTEIVDQPIPDIGPGPSESRVRTRPYESNQKSYRLSTLNVGKHRASKCLAYLARCLRSRGGQRALTHHSLEWTANVSASVRTSMIFMWEQLVHDARKRERQIIIGASPRARAR